MSREIDLDWENHQWVNQDEFQARATNEWHVINDTYFGGKYDFNGRMTKKELESFSWAAYEHCMKTHYDAAGVEPGARLRDHYSLIVNNRKVSWAGLCRRYGQTSYEIYLSYKYYEDWGNADMIDTLYHEIGHLTYGDHKEGFWKEGDRIGYGLAPKGLKQRPAKYRLYCTECGEEFFYLSRPNKYWRCGKCHPSFQEFIDLEEPRPWMKVEKYTGPEILLWP